MNGNEGSTYPNLWDTVKTMLREKHYTFNALIGIQGRLKMSEPHFQIGSIKTIQ